MSTTSKYQKFRTETIPRDRIQNAPYNPRKIGSKERAKLKKNLKTVGLLDTLVWNETTGNLVSGHQRLSILDELEKGTDYNLTVAVVSLDDKAEKEQNIFFNSKATQGQFDEGLLAMLLPDIDTDLAGLDALDLSVMGLGDDDFLPPVLPERTNEERAERKEQMQATRKEIAATLGNSDIGETHVTLSFGSTEAKETFLIRYGYPAGMRIVKGEQFEEKLSLNVANVAV